MEKYAIIDFISGEHRKLSTKLQRLVVFCRGLKASYTTGKQPLEGGQLEGNNYPKQNRLKRRIFCRSHLHWNVACDWAKMIFSDETQVVIGKNRRVQECEKMDTALSWDLQ